MTIDMIFTDINLGGTTTGWDVAKRFRSEQPDIPACARFPWGRIGALDLAARV
jgi:hypothetical protein